MLLLFWPNTFLRFHWNDLSSFSSLAILLWDLRLNLEPFNHRRIKGQREGNKARWSDGRTDGPTDGPTDRRTNGPTDRPTDRCTNGRTDPLVEIASKKATESRKVSDCEKFFCDSKSHVVFWNRLTFDWDIFFSKREISFISGKEHIWRFDHNF